MPKIGIELTFICFSLLILPNSSKVFQDSKSRYLLVELDSLPDIDKERDVTTDVTAVPKVEGVSTKDLESLTEGDEDDADPNGGYRASNVNHFYNTYF